ncbi:MAG: B12-binding domain-containing protein [Gemmatimonadales bacterium]|nr:B12-binding domain-containing protein [Gemmatimonadales bacterium]
MSETRQAPKHPIQVVTRRTGLSADVLRAWERRYEAVVPLRTGSRRRLYSDRDVERLGLLKQVTDAGRPIGQVARWTDAQLREVVQQDRAAEVARNTIGSADRPGEFPPVLFDRALRAVEQLDGQGLQQALDTASMSLSPVDLAEQILVPVMRTVGERWGGGTLGIAHEHMASAIVRNALSSIVLSRHLPGNGPGLVVATPTGQIHELGALVVAATAASVGWRVTYLGTDLPTDDIAGAVIDTGAKGVALSLTHPADDPHMRPNLRALRTAIPAQAVLIVGGLAAPAYVDATEDSGMLLLRDMASLRAILLSLRAECAENAA